MEEGHALLELKEIAKDYDVPPAPLPVLKGINLRVEKGELVGIIGPSGCGKSTLLNIIGALDRPTSGTIRFDDQDLLRMDAIELARFRNRQIGFVFQLHHLLPQCTVLENVLVPTFINKEGGRARERAEHLLERVGLGDRLTHRPGQLSGGERQRVAVVRAMVNGPQLLLADEPTGSLSQEGAETLARLMVDLNREEGMTFIVVTHSMLFAEYMDRVLEIREGKLIPHT